MKNPIRALSTCARAGFAAVCIFREKIPDWDSLNFHQKDCFLKMAYTALGGKTEVVHLWDNDLENGLYFRVVNATAQALGLTIKDLGQDEN